MPIARCRSANDRSALGLIRCRDLLLGFARTAKIRNEVVDPDRVLREDSETMFLRPHDTGHEQVRATSDLDVRALRWRDDSLGKRST